MAVRAAAPDAEIVVLALYNPLAVFSAATNLFTLAINQAITAVAVQNRARVADPFAAFDLAPPQPQTLCVLTLICTPFVDIHASDLGYAVIADLMWAASAYARFER